MAYYSGTANSLTALRTALLTHAQADGWTLTGNVLSKAGVFFQIDETATNIRCLGCESNAVANPAPGVVMIGRIYAQSGYPTREITYPCNYEVFGFAEELYLVVNYDSDAYQWLSFGKSSVPGLPGQGGWCAAIIGSAIPNHAPPGGYISGPVYLDMGGPSGITTAGGAFSACAIAGNVTNSVLTLALNIHVNSGLDGDGWKPWAGTGYLPIGMHACSELLWQQPSAWNSESALLPIRLYKQRPSFRISSILDLAHARYIRMDNLAPGDVLTLGGDRWKVFPWYRKDAARRNGSGTAVAGVFSYNHTGTFGWAIRYEGP